MAANFEIQYILKNIKPPFQGDEIELNANYITYFWFCENIEDMFLTGALEIEDTGGFFEKLPLTGEEILQVNITQNIERDKSDNTSASLNFLKTIEFEFFKTPIKDINKPRVVVYEFILAEKGFLNFFRKKYSKSYSQKRPHEIIEDICKNQLEISIDDYDLEISADRIDYIIPYWKPVTSIYDLKNKCRRVKSPQEGAYLFYSSIGDADRRKPIKKLSSFATLLEAKSDDSREGKFYFKKLDINPVFRNNIKECRNPNFNNRSIYKEGVSGKKYYHIDLINNKSITETTTTYTDFITKNKTLGNVSYLSNNLDDVDSDVRFSGIKSNDDIKREQNTSFRMSIENFNKREIILDGVLDRYAGKKIFIEEISDSISQVQNEKDSGEWLIKGVTNYFTIDNFEQKIIILKDCYTKNDIQGHITK